MALCHLFLSAKYDILADNLSVGQAVLRLKLAV